MENRKILFQLARKHLSEEAAADIEMLFLEGKEQYVAYYILGAIEERFKKNLINEEEGENIYGILNVPTEEICELAKHSIH